MEPALESTPWAPVDPLTEALFRVRMHGTFYSWAETSIGCSLEMPRLPECLSFHVVAHGEVWLDVDGAEPSLLEPGDVALVPRGLGHRLATDLGAPSAGRADELPQEMLGDHYSVLKVGPADRPSLASMLCGIVAFESAEVQQVLSVLPPLIVVRSGEAGGSSGAAMHRLVGLMLEEVLDPRPGGEAVTTRLADILVVHAVRAWLESDPDAGSGWLGALRDPDIGPAVAAVHRDPGRAWTVASLAAVATMSRSSFAERFTAVVGVPAMQYVTDWRMQVARRRLVTGGATVARVAADLGYSSEAAFGRAYKRVVGTSPGADRRRSAEATV